MLTVVDEREGIPLAVVRGGRPAKGDTIWLGKTPYCVTELDRDTVTVRLGAWTDPHCATGTQMRRRSLYMVNPGPADLAGYRGRRNPVDVPHYEHGPSYHPGYTGGAYRPPSGPPAFQRPVPYFGPPQTYEQPFPYSAPHTWRAFHYMYRFPIYDVQSYRPLQQGEREVFDGVEYEYTKIFENAAFVKPTIPWVGFVVAEDKRTGDGLAWVPLTNMNQISGAKQWLKKKLNREQGIARRQYHLHRKTGRQLTGYFRNNPNASIPSFRRD